MPRWSQDFIHTVAMLGRCQVVDTRTLLVSFVFVIALAFA